MPSRMENIAGLFSDVKTRTILVFVGIIFLTVMLVGVLGLARGPNTEATSSASSIPKAPGVASTPGITETTPEVARVQEALNEQRYQKALQQGKSAIPVDVGNTHASLSSEFGGFTFGDEKERTDPNVRDPNDKSSSQTSDASSKVTDTVAKQEQSAQAQKPTREEVLAKQATAKQQQQQQQQIAQQRSKDMKSNVQSMQNQMQSVMSAWGGKGGVANQEYQSRGESKSEQEKEAAEAAKKADEQVKASPPIIKAGEIMYAVLNTAVNSDEPSPILATLVTGPYKGAKLMGSIQTAKQVQGVRPRALILSFNLMNIPEQKSSIGVNAVAIDPDTARTALASHVDSHYTQRYGALFASSFMQGYGNAITQAGSTTFTNSDGSQTQVLQELSPQQELLAGLGEVGTQWGQELGEAFKRPNTITVDPGLSVGILFMSDVSITSNTQ